MITSEPVKEGCPPDGKNPDSYYLELTRRPETVTVWARVVVRAEKETLLPLEQLHYDEDEKTGDSLLNWQHITGGATFFVN